MGWWKVQGTEDFLGDVPLDILADAVAQVVQEYQGALNRRPSKAEWEAMLTEALLVGMRTERPEVRALEEGLVRQVTINLEEESR